MAQMLIINGSPRIKGNTAILCKNLDEIFKKEDVESEIIVLNKLKINPCRACDSCIRTGDLKCVQKDDMNSLFPKLLNARVIILACPIYWFTVSGQMKLFLDRLYALHGKEGFALKNKTMAAILVYGDVDEMKSGAINAIRTLQDCFSYCSAKYKKIIHGSANNPGDVIKNIKLMEDVKKLGKDLIEKY
jgi:multimeric flavodoxin WrbA